ncbi:MAG TPA: potassium-transporting ATPase subunit KdpC [Polyangiaceae bacterium]
MLRQLRSALTALVLLTLLTGVVYPLLVTAVAKVAFARQANGSLIEKNGQVVGSTLLGQPFDDPKYFWGRLSATSPFAYNAGASSGSNLGPTNPLLTANAKARIDALRAADPGDEAPVPIDLVTASGSGLDPHISPAAARYQIARVARARELDRGRVGDLVVKYTESPTLGLLGESRVNVVLLNSALDELH